MKLRISALLLIALFGCSSHVKEAQPGEAEPTPVGQIVYQDAVSLPLYGKAFEGDGPRYRRLPPELEGQIRDELWHLGCCSAGLYLRFRTDAPEIHARWTNTAFHMPHMTDCAVGGLDLYAYLDGHWRFVGSGFNWGDLSTEHEGWLVGNMEPDMREYMLYLGLYDDITSLQIGVPEGFALEQPVLESPRAERPIVMYGTSILQGGCCSRPGMVHTHILSRMLDRTVINLGFSGNALLDPEIAELMAAIPDPAVFVLDYVPNSGADLINEKGESFFRILREAHPEVPVIFVENANYPNSSVDLAVRKVIREKNAAQLALFRKLKAAGEKRIYYVKGDKLLGSDAEGCVDGVHFTDVGMMRYARRLAPVIKRASFVKD